MKSKLWQGILRITCACTASILIAACSSMPQGTPAGTSRFSHYNDHAMALGKLERWHVEGKIAVYMDNKNNSGNLTWQQKNNTFDLLITGPLGQGYLHIEGRPGWVMATTTEEQIQTTSIDDLFADHFEWTLPLQELHYWVRGIASPTSDARFSFADSGELVSLEQAGWQVNYRRYTQISGLTLPQKITIKGNDIELKLILKNWTNLYPLPG